jgi:hypothetical protein
VAVLFSAVRFMVLSEVADRLNPSLNAIARPRTTEFYQYWFSISQTDHGLRACNLYTRNALPLLFDVIADICKTLDNRERRILACNN